MKNHAKKGVSMFILILLVVPIIASASWWNPVSWFGGWFGLFHKYAVEETVSPPEEETSGGFFSGGGFFSRARPVENPSQTPTDFGSSTSQAGKSTTPPVKKNIINIPPAPSRAPTSNKPKTVIPPKTTGVVSFSEDIRVARRTAGTATSSNSMRIWFPSTSTKMTMKETAVSGISFKTGTCKAFPCTLTNVVSVTNRVAEGTYPVSVTITSGTSTAIGTFSIIVLPPESPEIQMTVSGPISVKKNVNGTVSGSQTVFVQLLRGTPEKLTLTNSEFPDGITGKATLGTCTPPCKLTNTVSVTYAAESGRHPMVIRATGAQIARSVGYDINVGYSGSFGIHFEGEKRTYTQNQNPTAVIAMDYPFDLLLDGGTPETASLVFKKTSSNASTSVTYSRTTCLLPCLGLNAHIEMLPGMKVTTHTVKLEAVVERVEDDGRGGTKIVKYTETRSIPVKIVPLPLPY